MYFAESRVLVHLLISDPQFAETKSMERYITSVQSGADSVQAARDAFGDLNQLQTELDAFVKNVSGPPTDLASTSNDAGSSPRTLTAPEIEARTADFLALRGRSEDAQDKLEEALMNQPSLAEAEQSLGYILLKKNDLDEAQKHFESAVQLNPNDALNFYGQGLVAMNQAGNSAVPPGAIAAFEKAASLNPDFAPSWYYLAMIYSQRDETLQKALTDAQRAASLAPGESRYQLQLAALLERSGRPEEARKTAVRVQESAGDRATPDKAGELAARLSKPQPPATPASASTAPTQPPADPGLRIERKTEPSTATTVSPAPKPEPAPAPAPPLLPNPPRSIRWWGRSRM